MGGKHEQSLTLPLGKRHDLGREQINVNISLEKIVASGFIIYPELSCGNDYKQPKNASNWDIVGQEASQGTSTAPTSGAKALGNPDKPVDAL